MILDQMPGPGFGPLVERFRLVQGSEEPRDTILDLPVDCHFAVGFLLGETWQAVIAGGPSTVPYTARAADGVDYVWIRFRAGRMPRLVDVRPADLVDGSIDGFPTLFGEPTDALCERLRAARGLPARREILESLLRSGLEKPLCQDRRCVRALERIEAARGQIQVTEVARELGLSPRSLQRMFLDQVGMAPKQFIRHLRFQKTLQRITRMPASANLGRLAHACGYADQSHFIREFRTLAGRLPTTFLTDGASSLPCRA